MIRKIQKMKFYPVELYAKKPNDSAGKWNSHEGNARENRQD